MTNTQQKNVMLIGAGIMSSTLATLLNKLEPDWNIKIFERLSESGKESSDGWNNAGTGHEALCELNYTVERKDGSIDTSKAIEINEQFQISKQFWAHLVQNHEITHPQEFIRSLPHISFVNGEKNIEFLQKRFEALSKYPAFQQMEFSDVPKKLMEWIPVMMKDRATDELVAATKVSGGTDVNFGELTRKMMANLEGKENIDIRYNSDVLDLHRTEDRAWEVKVQNDADHTLEYHTADFVFIGGGGGAIPLLQKTKILESKSIGGFPISGEFVICRNPEIVSQHEAKVYGKEPPGTPPMTVPHLDRRYLRDETVLLFGPFAGFGPKLLKEGSNSDFFKTLKPNNMLTMLNAGVKNLPLIKYSVDQVLLSKKDRMDSLRTFMPDAKDQDWELIVAGKRVQVIKDIEGTGKGIIQFGTEIVQSADRSVAALLGESPGASTSVAIMLDVLEQSFPASINEWEPKIKEMIPSYDQSLAKNEELFKKVQDVTTRSLEL